MDPHIKSSATAPINEKERLRTYSEAARILKFLTTSFSARRATGWFPPIGSERLARM